MAIATTYKKQEQLAQQQQPTQSRQPYNGMRGVSENTANNLGNYQQGYQPSQQVQQAQDNLAQVQAQKPQSYNSKWAPQMENILQQIQNPKEFKYEFNGDNLFKYYADLYTQKGKQASMDAMGQAAALTGGYGNTYAQQVGQQQYQQYLLDLYDRGMDLRDRAYQQHQDQLADQYNIYNTIAGQDNTDYGRYRDTMGDWQTDLQYATDRADRERDFDYNMYNTDLNYWTNMAQNEAAAEKDWADLEEKQREFDANLTEEQRQYNQNLAVDYATAILANGQIPSNELLVAAGLSLEDAQKLMAQITSGGSGGGNAGDVNKKLPKNNKELTKDTDTDKYSKEILKTVEKKLNSKTPATSGAAKPMVYPMIRESQKTNMLK